MRRAVYGQKGYNGTSMSVRAVQAYANEERPISKWSKRDILEAVEELDFEDASITMDEIKTLPVWILKKHFLTCTSWHHTGKYMNATDFYSIDETAIEADMEFYQDEIRMHKAALEATKEERKARRLEVEKRRAEKRAEKAFKEKALMYWGYTKYKTQNGYLKAVKDGRVNLQDLIDLDNFETFGQFAKCTNAKELAEELAKGTYTLKALEEAKAKFDAEEKAKAEALYWERRKTTDMYTGIYTNNMELLKQHGINSKQEAVEYLRSINNISKKLQKLIDEGGL